MADEYYPLTQNIVKNLLDKLYDKRKSAAIDIEKLVKQCQSQGKTDEIEMIIRHCGESFCTSTNCHNRKGGSIGLAAVAIALGKQADEYCEVIICPSIKLLQDPDPRVRYYACESLYNCIKVLGGNVLPYFQSIFDALAKGYEDTDKDVRSAIMQLDRSMRETVMDSDKLDVASIVTYLRDKIYPKSTQARLFLINWITSLDRTSGVNMVLYLPEILDGLLVMLDDPDDSLVNKLKTLLNQFLKKLLESEGSDFGYRRLMNIFVFQINNPHCSNIVLHTALVWMARFTETFRYKMLPFTSMILKAILPFFDVDAKDESIRNQARAVSGLLLDLVKDVDNWTPAAGDVDQSESDKPNVSCPSRLLDTNQNPQDPAAQIQPSNPIFPGYPKIVLIEDPEKAKLSINTKLRQFEHSSLGLSETLNILCEFSGDFSQQTKLAALEWLHVLMDVAPRQTLLLSETVFPSLFKFVIDPSSGVIRAGLQLVAKFSKEDVHVDPIMRDRDFLSVPEQIKGVLSLTDNPYLLRFLYDLIRHLDIDSVMLEERGDLIVGDLCYELSPNLVFNTIAEIIQKSDVLQGKFNLIHKLNRILLSNQNLISFRSKIKSINSEEYCHVFCRLYRAWSFNRVALLSLCLLSQNYEHCRHLIKTFGDQEMDVDTLNEIDLLIQFLEAPVFAFLRMHLMDPRHSAALTETLYGLLMLIPQSDAFRILLNRLNCIPKHHNLANLIPFTEVADPNRALIDKLIDFPALLDNLRKVQNQIHVQALAKQHQLQGIHTSLSRQSFLERNLSL